MNDILALIQAFESTALPLEDWHHREHLIVAWHYLRRSPEQAEALIRSGIQRYNASKGIATTPTGGYHETLTMFFAAFVRSQLNATLSAEQEIAHVLEHCSFEHIFTYYSRERLKSAEARQIFVEPDLRNWDLGAQRAATR